jgi:hypothetical protein
MPPEPPSAPERIAQRLLGDYIRDPDRATPPPGIEPRRLKVYRELFFNNVQSLLAGNFPVISRIYGSMPDGGGWPALVRAFYRDHPARTPLFTELAREFVQYLQARADAGLHDPPWLPELAHYEWAELVLQIREADAPPEAPTATPAALLEGTPRLSPLAWALHYRWPVHRIGPEHRPNGPPPEPTFLLLLRDTAGKVQFQQLSAPTFRLLQRLQEQPQLSGREQLRALAAEAQAPDPETFVEQGASMLEQLHRERAVHLHL